MSSKYSAILNINNKILTSQYLSSISLEERKKLITPVFEHFRNTGWLFPDDVDEIISSYKKLQAYNPELNKTELYNNSSLATNICKYYCHSFYFATKRNKKNMIEIFLDDDLLKKVIANRLGVDFKETFNLNFKMLIQGMRSMGLVPSISIFKPTIAKFIYMKYSNSGDTIYDYAAGFGGRMLGAASCDRKYIGVDPLTAAECNSMQQDLNLKNCQVINSTSENFKQEENSIDLAFSSPPYYDQEYYSDEYDQAYNKNENYFYNVYWDQTLYNIKHMLKPNKKFILNVKNYPRMLTMAKKVFGDIIEEITLKTTRSHLTRKMNNMIKYEQIYIFNNIK